MTTVLMSVQFKSMINSAKARAVAACAVVRGFRVLLVAKRWKVVLRLAVVAGLFPVAAHYGAIALEALCKHARAAVVWWMRCLGGVDCQLWPYWHAAAILTACVVAFWLYRTLDSWIPRKWTWLAGSGCRQGVLRQDRAWRRGDEDRLSRHDFVQVLKLVICNAPRSDGAQYIGLYGSWGDGKTSVINMLKARSVKWPFVFVDFSPWNRASGSSYASVLFDEIAAQMPFRLFDPMRRLLRSFGRIVSVKSERRIGGFLIECAVDVMSWAAELFDVKKRLVARLDGIGRRIVVVIDDMDRLPPKDVYEVIRVIKANGDLPNVTYLVSADKDYLAKALAAELQLPGDPVRGGRQYLEKIIQTECPLPSIDRVDIGRELTEGANEIPRRYVLRAAGDVKAEDVAEVFPLVKNLRDVARVLNVFELDVAVQSRKRGMRSSMDIHVGDLLALSVMKVYCPSFVNRLHAFFDDWVYRSDHSIGSAAGKTSDWVGKTLIGDVSEEVRAVIMAFLEKRMHMSRKLIGPSGKDEVYVLGHASLPEGLNGYRLYSRFAFENYFSTKKDLVPVRKKLYRKFVGRLNSAPCDDVFLANVAHQHFLYPVLFMLDAESAQHSRKWVENLVASLSRIADLDLSAARKDGDSTFCADDDAYSALFDSTQRYLRRWNNDNDQAKDALSSGLDKAGSFQLRARFVSENLYAFRQGQSEENMLPMRAFQNHLDAVLDLFVAKERNGVIGTLPNKSFLRAIWCRIVKQLENPTRDADFKSAMAGVSMESSEMLPLLENFLVHDSKELRLMAFDLDRAEKLFDIPAARKLLCNDERANGLVEYLDFSLRVKEVGEPTDLRSQFDILRKSGLFSPSLAMPLVGTQKGEAFL